MLAEKQQQKQQRGAAVATEFLLDKVQFQRIIIFFVRVITEAHFTVQNRSQKDLFVLIQPRFSDCMGGRACGGGGATREQYLLSAPPFYSTCT